MNDAIDNSEDNSSKDVPPDKSASKALTPANAANAVANAASETAKSIAAGVTGSPDDAEEDQKTDYSSKRPSIVAMGIYLLLITTISVLFLTSLMMAENPAIINNNGKEQISCGDEVINIFRETPAATTTTTNPLAPTPANTNSAAGNETNINSNANTTPSATPASTVNNSTSPQINNANVTPTAAATANASNTRNNGGATNTTNTNTSPKPSPTSITLKIPKVSVAQQLCVGSFGFISASRFFPADSYLFLVVLFGGMMGGAIRGMSSFFRHLGYSNFSFKWAWYYILVPFTGAALSIVIYLVLRGGFYGGSFGEGLNLNVFSFAALAAVTGLFSENALEKLRQVAITLLADVPPKVKDAKAAEERKKLKEGKL